MRASTFATVERHSGSSQVLTQDRMRSTKPTSLPPTLTVTKSVPAESAEVCPPVTSPVSAPEHARNRRLVLGLAFAMSGAYARLLR